MIKKMLITIVILFIYTIAAQAALHNRSNGLIYDDDLNVTWLADANYAYTSGYDSDGKMTWSDAMNWAENLVYGGFDDWRLPTTLQPDLSCSIQSSLYGSSGYNCTGSEMGHLAYNELGGTAGSSILVSSDPNLVLFANIQTFWPYYWSSTEWAFNTQAAWNFRFDLLYMSGGFSKTTENYAWAVRDGDVIPSVIAIDIDVKPDSDPNCFNINGHGVIPVAILGSDSFDVTNIDQGSLFFGGLAVRVRGNKGPLCSVEYSDGDAFLDLVCHFEDDATNWAPGDDEATLIGTLFDNIEFEGTDSICVVP